MDKFDASGWKTYIWKITGLQSGNGGRESEIMSGLLNNNRSMLKDVIDEAKHSH